VVGLDTLAHVIRTMDESLPADPWHAYYQSPAWLKALIAKGALGQKSKAGVFQKVGKEIQVLDLAQQTYRRSEGAVDPGVAEILAHKDPSETFAKLRANAHPQAQFLWSIYCDLFHYAAYHLASIADNARDVDLAIRWGFGWEMGPFEIWQAAGWKQIARWIADDIAAGKALVTTPLPGWVDAGPASGGVHTPAGAYSAAANSFQPRSPLPVYKRQYFPDPVLGEKWPKGTTILETDALRMWHTGDDIAIASFKSKSNTIGEDVLDGMLAAIAEAEKNWRGLVIWQTREPFSFGANLASFSPAVQAGRWEIVEAVVAKFQHTSQRLKYSLIPTGPRYAVRRSAVANYHALQIGRWPRSWLPSVWSRLASVLLPGGGGCKERRFAPRRGGHARANGSRWTHCRSCRIFSRWRWRRCSGSALEAKDLVPGPADVVTFIAYAVLSPRRRFWPCRSVYRPPLPQRNIPVVGKTARDPGNDAGQHARRRVHLRVRFCRGVGDCTRTLRRRRRKRQPGRREMVARTRAQGIHDAAQESKDTRADRAHLEDRQAA
jgi:3-hydroxyacyl-CoA dehydrogenase